MPLHLLHFAALFARTISVNRHTFQSFCVQAVIRRLPRGPRPLDRKSGHKFQDSIHRHSEAAMNIKRSLTTGNCKMHF